MPEAEVRAHYVAAVVIAVAACARATAPSSLPASPRGSIVVDRSAAPCTVSYDGVIWYRIPSGGFPPMDVRFATCGFETLGRNLSPDPPRWAMSSAATQTRFVFTSLQEVMSAKGSRDIERTAAAHGIPVSWMVGDIRYMAYAADYNALHAAHGDDAQAQFWPDLHAAMLAKLPWYVPSVSILTAGEERNIGRALSFHEHAFWGITWNSRGTDDTFDYGAPWGTYCADVHSYKRPQPDGGCALLAFEWTARDLTRAYLSGREDAFSTDPDDLLRRGGFSPKSAAAYARKLVDAFAAAGQTQPIVMIVQVESIDGKIPANMVVINALLDEVVRDGLKRETLTQATHDARTFSAAPRAVAFPFIPGGTEVPSRLLHGDTLYPATIDYHDSLVGMTFLSGRSLPTRVFRYSDYPVSHFDRPLPQVPSGELPSLLRASVRSGWLELTVAAPRALRYGVAIWSDPQHLRITGPGEIRAGRAATVLVFDLKAGMNNVRYRCSGCRSTTFNYSL
ncbi:MAG TPA: hypothetical protein VEW74_06825 [Candidatus Nitrosotalea sp.]|nr:hypothetical protein [Candidatus Nitrosotalea sp.]